MRAHRSKTTRIGPARYFACGNVGCRAHNLQLLYLGSREAGWQKAVDVPRGPEPKGAKLICGRCGKRGTLRSRGFFRPTAKFPKRNQRYECVDLQCRRRGRYPAKFRLVGTTLIPVSAPGFQQAYPPPKCHVHSCEMQKRHDNEPVVDGVRVHRWKCPHRGCPEVASMDSRGRVVTSKPPRVAQPRWPKCWIPKCPRQVTDYEHDRRNHYCDEHRQLTRLQRHRLRRKQIQWIERDADSRLGPIPVVGPPLRGDGLKVDFARWLRDLLDSRDMSPRAAANQAKLPQTTVWNWTAGVSMPTSDEDFHPLGQLLGPVSLRDFYSNVARVYSAAHGAANGQTH